MLTFHAGFTTKNYSVGDLIRPIFNEPLHMMTVSASDHELTKLRLIFPDLPHANLPTVIFVGENARFIYENLKGFKFDERIKF